MLKWGVFGQDMVKRGNNQVRGFGSLALFKRKTWRFLNASGYERPTTSSVLVYIHISIGHVAMPKEGYNIL